MKKLPLELLFWIGALIALFFARPGEQHFTLCPLNRFGLEFCPGCGIGRSLHYCMRGDWESSFSSHYLGPIALIVILVRIAVLIKHFFKEKIKVHE